MVVDNNAFLLYQIRYRPLVYNDDFQVPFQDDLSNDKNRRQIGEKSIKESRFSFIGKTIGDWFQKRLNCCDWGFELMRENFDYIVIYSMISSFTILLLV